MAVIEAGSFNGFKRAQQSFGDLACFVGSESAVAQHVGERLIEGLHHRVYERLVVQTSGAGPANREQSGMFEASGRLQTCLDGILVVQRLENTDRLPASSAPVPWKPCGAALAAQQLAATCRPSSVCPSISFQSGMCIHPRR